MTSESIIKEAPTAREAAAAGLLQASAIGFTGESTPAGCLLARSAISCSVAAADVQKALRDIRFNIEKRFRSKIVKDRSLHKLKPKIDADALAGHIMAVIQAMSTLARDGETLVCCVGSDAGVAYVISMRGGKRTALGTCDLGPGVPCYVKSPRRVSSETGFETCIGLFTTGESSPR